jgi:hypothetical protein
MQQPTHARERKTHISCWIEGATLTRASTGKTKKFLLVAEFFYNNPRKHRKYTNK